MSTPLAAPSATQPHLAVTRDQYGTFRTFYMSHELWTRYPWLHDYSLHNLQSQLAAFGAVVRLERQHELLWSVFSTLVQTRDWDEDTTTTIWLTMQHAFPWSLCMECNRITYRNRSLCPACADIF